MKITTLTRTLATVGALALLIWMPSVAAAQGTLFVEGDNVGIGTPTPAFPLQITRDGATVDIRDTSATASSRILLRLTNKGRINFNLFNEDANENWQFSNTLIGFQINQTTSPGLEMRLDGAGDLYLEGQVFASSSRAGKERVTPVDPQQVLSTLARMPLSTWVYRQQPGVSHIGPMAEDFHALFGFGVNPETLSPSDTSGVALAAVQGLYGMVQERDRQISDLESALDAKAAEVEALEQRLRSLEEKVEGLTR